MHSSSLNRRISLFHSYHVLKISRSPVFSCYEAPNLQPEEPRILFLNVSCLRSNFFEYVVNDSYESLEKEKDIPAQVNLVISKSQRLKKTPRLLTDEEYKALVGERVIPSAAQHTNDESESLFEEPSSESADDESSDQPNSDPPPIDHPPKDTPNTTTKNSTKNNRKCVIN